MKRSSFISTCCVFFILIIWLKAVSATSCPPELTITIRDDKKTTVDVREAYVSGEGNEAVNPQAFNGGDTLCIIGNSSNNNVAIHLLNFSEIPGIGEQNPVTITNQSGQVVFNGTNDQAILLVNSSYVHVTGSGDPSHQYGFLIDGNYSKGFKAYKQSDHFELDHIEIANVNGEAVAVKASADCSDASIPAEHDPTGEYIDAWGRRVKQLSWSNLHDYNNDGLITNTDVVNQQNGTLYDINIHHLYIHDSGKEGMYIGDNRVYPFYNTNPDPDDDPHLYPGAAMGGRTICNYFDDSQSPPLEIASGENDPLNGKIEKLNIHHNIVERTGWDSINIKSAARDCRLYDNTIREHSWNYTSDQRGGFTLQPGTVCNIYRNRIIDGIGSGIFTQGSGGYIANNLIVRTGRQGDPGEIKTAAIAIYSSSLAWPELYDGQYFVVANNTIIEPLSYGIFFAVDYVVDHIIANNLTVATQTPDPGGNSHDYHIDNNSTVDIFTANEYYADNSNLDFIDPAADDYRIGKTSPLIDAGEDPIVWTATDESLLYDADQIARPSWLAYDIGAFEYADSNKHCSGIDPVINNISYSGTASCVASNSITAGENVLINNGADVQYTAPIVRLLPGFQSLPGSQLRISQ